MTASPVSRIGDYIREQRESSRLSLRRLAEESGISNPYLSQIERGLRKPSAEILQQIAKALRISAEQLYVQAGLLEDRGSSLAVETAVLGDPMLSERQKRVLLDIYDSFLNENEANHAEPAPAPAPRPKQRTSTSTAKSAGAKPAAAKKAAAKKASAKKASVRKSTARKTTARKATARKTTQAVAPATH